MSTFIELTDEEYQVLQPLAKAHYKRAYNKFHGIVKAVPDEAEKTRIQGALCNRFDTPLDQHDSRNPECGSEHEYDVPGDECRSSGAGVVPGRLSIAAGCLVEATPLAKPSFRDQEDDCHHDEEQDENVVGRVFVPVGRLW